MSLCLTFNFQHQKDVLKTPINEYFIATDSLKMPIASYDYAKVFKGVTFDGQEISIKQIPKNAFISNAVRKEIDILKSNSKAPRNMLFLIDECEDNENYYIVSQCISYGMMSNIFRLGVLTSEDNAVEYLRQIVFGVNELHKRKIIHKDLKPKNIFVTENTEKMYPLKFLLVIGDFGLDKEISTKSMNSGAKLASAPEENVDFTEKSDVYSLGCIFYYMLCGKFPFDSTSDDVCEAQKKSDKISILSSNKYSLTSMKVLEGCLQYNESTRMDMDELRKILDIDSLYTNYHKVDVSVKDSSNEISLRLRTLRKPFTPEIAMYSTRNRGGISSSHNVQPLQLRTGLSSSMISPLSNPSPMVNSWNKLSPHPENIEEFTKLVNLKKAMNEKDDYIKVLLIEKKSMSNRLIQKQTEMEEFQNEAKLSIKEISSHKTEIQEKDSIIYELRKQIQESTLREKKATQLENIINESNAKISKLKNKIETLKSSANLKDQQIQTHISEIEKCKSQHAREIEHYQEQIRLMESNKREDGADQQQIEHLISLFDAQSNTNQYKGKPVEFLESLIKTTIDKLNNEREANKNRELHAEINNKDAKLASAPVCENREPQNIVSLSEKINGIKKFDSFYDSQDKHDNIVLCLLSSDKLQIYTCKKAILLSKIKEVKYIPVHNKLKITTKETKGDKIILRNSNPLTLLEWGKELNENIIKTKNNN